MSLFNEHKEKNNSKKDDILDNKETSSQYKFNLFGFIDDIWKKQELKKYSDFEKQKVSFMLNRFLSIKYPLQSSLLSHQNIEQTTLVNWWIEFLQCVYKTKPNFFYTKTKNDKEKIKKEVKFCEQNYSPDVIRILKQKYNLWDNKTWQDVKENQSENLILSIKQIESDLGK